MKSVLLAALVAALVTIPAKAEELTGTLKKIKDSGTITLAYREQSPPFSSVDATGKPVGYSIDLCQRIVSAVKTKLGLNEIKVQYVAVTPENRMDKIIDGAADIECGSTTNTLSRQEKVDFTNPIFITGASLLVKGDSDINGVGDLGGKTVAVVSGTTTEAALKEAIKKAVVDAKVVTVKDHNEGLAQLTSGKADAYASDQIILIGLARNTTDQANLALAQELFTYEPYGLMVRRNDADFRLVANRVLAQLYRTGEIGSVYNKWFGDWGAEPSRLLIAMYALNGLPE